MNDATERDKSFEHDVTGYQEPNYEELPEPEEVEIRKLNRHERRKRAKLARRMAVKERLEKKKLKAHSS